MAATSRPITPLPPTPTIPDIPPPKKRPINLVKHLLKKGGKGGTELNLDELDEGVLRSRKTENEWYRSEIETVQRDTNEYIAYLEQKRSEKQTAIDNLVAANKADLEEFQAKKKAKEAENAAKMEELKKLIEDLELKQEQKQQEVNQLSDVMARRARHESDMAKLRREMAAAESDHQDQLSKLERKLLEERMKLQKEADARIAVMESAAHDKASKYLHDHTTLLSQENTLLATQLRACIHRTQILLARKDQLDKQNAELLREHRL
ncbi:hypothetical protein HK097_004467, partial [Rhizophlyctis rosea]